MSMPISARKDGVNFVASTGPDACLTPPQPVPVAYMSIAFFGKTSRLSRSVRNNGAKDFQLNSRATLTTGHEPGSAKGVSVPGYKKYSFPEKGSKSVYSEGWSVIRDDDPGKMNAPSPGGTEPRRNMQKTSFKHI